MRSSRALVAALALACAPAVASANSAPERTSIRNGESFDLSPFSFQASYSREVTVVAVRLVDQDGGVRGITLDRMGPSRFVSIDLPVLAPHGYRLEWRVRDGQGAETAGAVAFTVRGCETLRLPVSR